MEVRIGPDLDTRSRRRQPPTDMTSSSETPPEGAQAPPQPSLVIAKPRDPGLFTGTGDQEVEDWIDLYERVSVHNRCDGTIMLANVIFYLRDTARTWFETHEEELTSWDLCKAKLQDLFGRPTGRKLSAKRKLASRVQTSTESYVTYIQDVLSVPWPSRRLGRSDVQGVRG